MKYTKGDIVIIRFPFSVLSQIKKRPALIISNEKVNKTGDYLLVQITSKIRNDSLSLMISKSDYTNKKELPLKSCIRIHKIFLLNENLIFSKITRVNQHFLDLTIERNVDLIS